ncbi:MAG: Exodeoxyribonuclease small subunit [Alphaproteobacteria bacterium]|nr:Exodeoxyribonuclease small subunit [Alphaproteobacteria bacterium]
MLYCPTMTDKNASISDLSFEDALAALEKIVRNLESGSAGLEQSIRDYEQGVALRKHCEAKLKDAQLRVEKLSLNAAGQPQTAEFDLK